MCQMVKCKIRTWVIAGSIFALCFFIVGAKADSEQVLNNFSLAADLNTVRDVSEDFYAVTGYRLSFSDPAFLDNPVIGRFENISLHSLVKRLLKGYSYALIEDEANRRVEVDIFAEGGQSLNRSRREGAARQDFSPARSVENQAEELPDEQYSELDDPIAGLPLVEVEKMKAERAKELKQLMEDEAYIESLVE